MPFPRGLNRWRGAAVVLAIGTCATVISGAPPRVVAAPAATPKASCSGASCVGKDPVTAGCTTSAKVVLAETVGPHNLTLLYSPACHAAWGQHYYATAGPNDTGAMYVFVAPKHGGPETFLPTSIVGTGAAHTTMIDWDDAIKICFRDQSFPPVVDPSPDPRRDNTPENSCTRWT